MKILVTGYKSGLGRYLYEEFGAEGLGSGDRVPEAYYDVIVHCDRADGTTTRRFLGIPHGKFIYISSVDVYEALRNIPSEYAAHKLHGEELTKLFGVSPVVIRLGALVGKYMRKNNLVRMFNGEQMTLSPESTFGFISYEGVSEYIRTCNGLTGTTNLLGKVRTLGSIAKECGLNPKWGLYTYLTPDIPTDIEFIDFNSLKGIK